jgi:hypothetical protein
LYVEDDISCIDTPRASQLAFAAKHAFFCFRFYIPGFTPLDISNCFSQAETGKNPGATRCRAGAAGYAYPECRLVLKQVPFDTPVIAVVIDLAVKAYRIAEVWFQVSGFWFQVSGFRFQVSGFRFQVSSF